MLPQAVDRDGAILKTAFAAILVNTVLAALKLIVGVLGHSQALIADGLHSLSDLLSDALVIVAGRRAAQGPDHDHPYGHARYETMATLALSLLLIGVSIGLGWDAAARLFSPSALLQPSPVVLGAAAISILAKEWLCRWTLGYAERIASEMLRANAWHHRSDAISSVVVLVGVAGTLAGLPYLDSVAAFAVAAMIAHIGWGLGRAAIGELVDTGLEPGRLAAVRSTIRSVGGVKDIHMLRTRRLGGRASADVHVLVEPDLSVSEGHMISLLVEQRLKREIDEVTDVTVHIDPEDDERTAPCSHLPLRAEVQARLASLWSEIPTANERQRIVLHYLGGRLDVDVYFPLSTYDRPGADPDGLKRRLKAALSEWPAIRNLGIYYG